MAKPVQIKRIDLLVHPFYDPRLEQGCPSIPYNEEVAKFLFKEWKGQIDEAAKDPNRLLFLSPAPSQAGWQAQLSEELISYAMKRLGKRFGFFMKPGKRVEFHDRIGFGFRTFKKLLKKNGFVVNPDKMKTRGFGEYTNSCVVEYLTMLNIHIGFKQPIPYKNRQSAILVRKSVGADLKPWEIKELKKNPKGRTLLKKKVRKLGWRRTEVSKYLAKKYPEGTTPLKLRLKRKRR